MSFISNMFGFSPAKGTPAPKRKRGSMSGISAQNKRTRVGYDPKEYQNTGYGSSGTVTMNEDEESTDDSDTEAGQSGKKKTPTTTRIILKGVDTRRPSRTMFLKAVESNAKLQKAEKILHDRGGMTTSTRAEIEEQRRHNDKIIEAVALGGNAPPVEVSKEQTSPQQASPIVINDSESDEVSSEQENDSEVSADLRNKPPMLSRPRSPITQYTAALPQKAHSVEKKLPSSIEQIWLTKPNLRARTLNNKSKVLAELAEPEYTCRDAEIRDGIWQIMDQIERFAKQHFGGEVEFGKDTGHPAGMVTPRFFEMLEHDTVKLIDCIGSGGPSGIYGWHDLFFNEQKRRALVCAIIGKILTEQVFQHKFFGGSAEHFQYLAALEVEYRNHDGFERNAHYANYIRSVLSTTKTGPLVLPPNFTDHVNTIIGALWVHLSPILCLTNFEAGANGTLDAAIFTPLHKLVTEAALISLHMRLDAHTVYHHEPMFKEDNFDSTRMECFNKLDMMQQNPRNAVSDCSTKEQERRAQLSETERARSKGDQLLTLITIMDGITAYRLGGWEAPSSRLDHVVYEKPKYKDMGVRTRTITHGWVYCRWGRPRSAQATADLGEETGKKIHGNVWRKGGFANFTDVDGVPDWVRIEKLGRKAEAEGRKRDVLGDDYEEEMLPVKKVDKGKGRAREERGVKDISFPALPQRDFSP